MNKGGTMNGGIFSCFYEDTKRYESCKTAVYGVVLLASCIENLAVALFNPFFAI
jgi:hypothetical protein